MQMGADDPNQHAAMMSSALVDIEKQDVVAADSPSGAGADGAAAAGTDRAATEAETVAEVSSCLRQTGLLIGIAELIAAIIVLHHGWDQYCDKPLRTWIVVYIAPWVFFIPYLFMRIRGSVLELKNMTAVMIIIGLFWLAWLIVGHVWYFTASDSHCVHSSPGLSKFTYAMIITNDIILGLPVAILLPAGFWSTWNSINV